MNDWFQERIRELNTLLGNEAIALEVNQQVNWMRLLENVFIMEYNDGTYKRANPIIEHSSTYRHYVG